MSEETIQTLVITVCITLALCVGIVCGTKCGLNTSNKRYQAIQSIVNSNIDDGHKLLQIKALLWNSNF